MLLSIRYVYTMLKSSILTWKLSDTAFQTGQCAQIWHSIVSSIFFHKCKVQTLTSFPGHIPGFFSPLIFLHGYEIVWVWHGKETTEALVRVSGTLVPRSLPDFIFLHSCEIKSVSGLGTRLGLRMLLLTHCTCINQWYCSIQMHSHCKKL